MTPFCASSRNPLPGWTSRVPRSLLCIAATLMLASGALTSCSGPYSQASSASPTPNLPLAPLASMAQAWGPSTATFTTQIDATHFIPDVTLAPDGRSLYGHEVTEDLQEANASWPAPAGILDIATHAFTPIGLASAALCDNTLAYTCLKKPPLSSLQCCLSDGRFLITFSESDTVPVCVYCLWSYDRQTSTLYEVAAGRQLNGLSADRIGHGVLAFYTGAGVSIADLAARTLKHIPGTTAGSGLIALSWPYVLYGTSVRSPGTTTVRTSLAIYNIDEHTSTALPQVSGTLLKLVGSTLYYVAGGRPPVGGGTLYEIDHITDPGARPRVLARLPSGPNISTPQSFAITGDTLFYSVTTGIYVSNPHYPTGMGCFGGYGQTCPTLPPTPRWVTTLFEVDQHRSRSPQVRAIAAYDANLVDVKAANARLVILSGAAWDRAEGRFVALKPLDALRGYAYVGPEEQVSGNFVMVSQPISPYDLPPLRITLYDTSHLPVLAG
jgi:hypothetical protein